jgi:nucleoid DNA-binding protein
MANASDILHRTASRLGLDPQELRPYMDAMLALCSDALDSGDCVELMTFGTLFPASDSEAFRPHASLFPPAQEQQS